MLAVGFVFGLACSFLEIALMNNIPALKRAYHHGIGPIKPVVCTITGSLILSFILGEVFVAEGVTIMMGGIMSTCASLLIVSATTMANDAGWDKTRVKSDINGVLVRVQTYREPVKNFLLFARQFLLTIVAILKALTLPFRMAVATWVAAKSAGNKVKTTATAAKAKVTGSY